MTSLFRALSLLLANCLTLDKVASWSSYFLSSHS
uniref:Uncharacterized protein n=1 Tax=Solanum lycopersicum TaxID=4081 RepID=A0A3Q7HBZ9_SOLLC